MKLCIIHHVGLDAIHKLSEYCSLTEDQVLISHIHDHHLTTICTQLQPWKYTSYDLHGYIHSYNITTVTHIEMHKTNLNNKCITHYSIKIQNLFLGISVIYLDSFYTDLLFQLKVLSSYISWFHCISQNIPNIIFFDDDTVFFNIPL